MWCRCGAYIAYVIDCVIMFFASWNQIIILWIFSKGMGYVISGVYIEGLLILQTNMLRPRSRLTW